MHINKEKLLIDTSHCPLLYIDYHNNDLYKRNLIINKSLELIGSPYSFSKSGPNSFDSAGLVQYVYKESINKILPNLVHEQLLIGKKILILEDLIPGDAIFLSKGTHTGIYIGNNEFIHSPYIGKRVKISTIYDFYCGACFL